MERTDSEDLPPEAPTRPDDEDCCHGGCDRCVLDLYEDALERYQAALRAWRDRHPDREPTR